MKPIAIIIPVYNVEPYLERCLRSVLLQTFTNIKVLLIDDGSTDKSSTICDIYSKRDNRIIVFHKKNGGLSSARNVGLQYLKSHIKDFSYFTFVDSDDFIHVDYVKYMVEPLIKRNDINIAVSGQTSANFIADSRYEYIDSFLIYKERKKYSYVSSNNAFKMFRIKLIDKLFFPLGKIHEDIFVIPKAILSEQKIAVLRTKMYHYTIRKDSISHSGFNLKRLDRLEALKTNVDFVIDNNIDAKYHFINEYFTYFDFLLKKSKKFSKTIFKEIKKNKKNELIFYKQVIIKELSFDTYLRYKYNNRFFRCIIRIMVGKKYEKTKK